jgi:hypothetical protein
VEILKVTGVTYDFTLICQLQYFPYSIKKGVIPVDNFSFRPSVEVKGENVDI